MTRPARNIQALVSISLEGLVPGADETINDAVARWVNERINLDRHVAAGVDAVYTDGEGFLDDFMAGDVPCPGIYGDDRHGELGTLGPLGPIKQAEDTYPAGTDIGTYLADEGTTVEQFAAEDDGGGVAGTFDRWTQAGIDDKSDADNHCVSDGPMHCGVHNGPWDEGTEPECAEKGAQDGDSEALYAVGIFDGRGGIEKRHVSGDYDLGYAEGEADAEQARDHYSPAFLGDNHCESDGSGTCLVHFGRLEDTDGSEGPDVCDLSPDAE